MPGRSLVVGRHIMYLDVSTANHDWSHALKIIQTEEIVAESAKSTTYLLTPHCQTSADTQFRLYLPYLYFDPGTAGSNKPTVVFVVAGTWYMNTDRSAGLDSQSRIHRYGNRRTSFFVAIS